MTKPAASCTVTEIRVEHTRHIIVVIATALLLRIFITIISDVHLE